MSQIREVFFDIDDDELHAFLIEHAMAAYTLGLPARMENVDDNELGLQIRFTLFDDAPEEFHSRWAAPAGARLVECVVAEREESTALLEQLSDERWLKTTARAHWINMPTFADVDEVGGWTRAWVVEYYDRPIPEHGGL